MPLCFQLFKKGEKEATPLNTIDSEVCQLLGVAEHPDFYCTGWFNSIGYLIASGKKLGSQELRDAVATWYTPRKEETDIQRQVREDVTADLQKILAYFEENYTDSAWYEVGKRR